MVGTKSGSESVVRLHLNPPLLTFLFAFLCRDYEQSVRQYGVFRELFDLQLFSDKHREEKEKSRKKKVRKKL